MFESIQCDESPESNLRSPIQEVVPSIREDAFSTKERLKLCLKPTYRIRRLRNKGAMLVIIWSFFLMTAYYFIDYQSLKSMNHVSFYVIQASISLTMPLAGWLADVRFGRFKIIFWSSVIMWIAAVLITLSFVVQQLAKPYHSVHHYAKIAFFALLGTGYGIFQANIIQFGVDQLTDASTTEIISFINWYTWAFMGSGAIAYIIPKCTKINHQYSVLAPLLLCAGVSVIVISIFFFKNVLIKEPTTKNPFKLIYKVIKYAIYTKYPVQRSAFTYWEDKLPSRIDFGKNKYGGPFTTEQVEDVKTFLRMLVLIFLVGSVYGITEEKMLKLDVNVALKYQEAHKTLDQCLLSFMFVNIYYITGAVLIPINEFFIYPVFHRCLPNIICHWKVIMGIFIHLARYIVLITLFTVTHHKYMNSFSTTVNSTVQCLFINDTDFLRYTIDYRWFSLSEFFNAVSFLLIIIGTIEFYCAQVPYSMKGLVAGTFFFLFLVFYMLSNGMPQIFIINPSIWKAGSIFSCEFWYLMTKFIYLLIVFVVSVVIMTKYKRRKREDVLPNEQIFAEEFFDRTTS